MPEPIAINSMDTLLTRPLDLLAMTSLDQLQAIAMRAAELVDEARWLEGCALLAELSPVETHEALRARPPSFLFELHSMVMERAYRAMPRDEARDLLSEVELEQVDAAMMATLADAFRHNPGLFIPGARPARRVAFLTRAHDCDGWVELAGGQILPWAYAPGGVGPSAVAEAARYVADTPGVERALVVGTHVKPGVVLPPELSFVCIAAIDTAARNPGPEAA